MKKNISDKCRIVRSVFGVAIIAVGLFPLKGLQGATLGIIGIAIGAIMLIVAAVGVCPAFIPLGIDQTKEEK